MCECKSAQIKARSQMTGTNRSPGRPLLGQIQYACESKGTLCVIPSFSSDRRLEWTFSTVKFWGESPLGKWKVWIEDIGKYHCITNVCVAYSRISNDHLSSTI